MINIDENHSWAIFLHRDLPGSHSSETVFLSLISWKWRLNRFVSIIIARIKMHKCCSIQRSKSNNSHIPLFEWAKGKQYIKFKSHYHRTQSVVVWFNQPIQLDWIRIPCPKMTKWNHSAGKRKAQKTVKYSKFKITIQIQIYSFRFRLKLVKWQIEHL